MTNIVIFGDSEYAEQIYNHLKFENYNVVGFTQNKEFIRSESIQGIPIIPFEELDFISRECNWEDFSIIVAIGYSQMNKLREKIYNQCIDNGYKIGTFISKYALVYDVNKIGEGSIVLANAYVGPNVEIGKCVFVGMNTVLAHDTYVGNFVFLAASICFGGNVKVGNNVFIGLRVTIKNGISIADGSFIGATSYVLKNTDLYGVYYGNPAKKLIKNSMCIEHV